MSRSIGMLKLLPVRVSVQRCVTDGERSELSGYIDSSKGPRRGLILVVVPQTYNPEDIPLKELNLSFINDFEYFLRTEGKKCRTNTIWGYMIVLKHIVSIARNDRRLPFNPFAGYINSPESVGRGYVTKAEIHTMMDTGMPDKTQELARDLFLFSTFTGLSYSDVKNSRTLSMTICRHSLMVTFGLSPEERRPTRNLISVC